MEWTQELRSGEALTMAGKKGMQVHIRPISSSIVLEGVSGGLEVIELD